MKLIRWCLQWSHPKLGVVSAANCLRRRMRFPFPLPMRLNRAAVPLDLVRKCVLGLLPNVIIDQHFAERGRIGQLIGAVHPLVLGALASMKTRR
ncbi:hypothetical protein [Sinorhizobium meliloti]|uniref:hypothetical protein n=1 Tax=Rhizobium meliloti TaxID=382 RepID=UPI001F487A26|nr:hypothetical protein [Sinorhizobium meliloti]